MAVCLGGAPVLAGSHLWKVNEVFSDSTGTIQFVELYNCCTTGETSVGGKTASSLTTGLTSAPFVSNLAAGSSFDRHLLIGTTGFAALPGAPALDATLPDGFLSLSADTIQWWVYAASVLTYTAGQLPADGVNSWNAGNVVGLNSPTNSARDVGSVDASAKPPAVPNGVVGIPMTVGPMDGVGAFEVFWDTAVCSNPGTHSILWGQGTDLPAAAGGTYALSGSVCGIGNTSPVLWAGSPTAIDGSGLIWWLIVTQSAAVEGPWGTFDGVTERDGPGAGGSSVECLVTSKDLSNTCGE